MVFANSGMRFYQTCDSFLRSLYKMVPWLFLVGCLLQGSSALKLTKLEVPQHAVVGKTVVLQCLYDMEGDEVYSVKWYKSGREFYRYLPKDKPPAQIYEVAGVIVDMNSSDQTMVTLKEVNLNSSGAYRCEISAEAPAFTTVSKTSEMLVINLPEDGPVITGRRPKYEIGDTVQVNCTTFRSKPAALLTWTVNGGKANPGHLKEFASHVDDDGLETSVLGLEFQIHDGHFKDGEMKLQCTASIAPVYHQSYEESVSGGNQLTSVLESKETLSEVRNTGHISRTWSSGITLVLHIYVLVFWLR